MRRIYNTKDTKAIIFFFSALRSLKIIVDQHLGHVLRTTLTYTNDNHWSWNQPTIQQW